MGRGSRNPNDALVGTPARRPLRERIFRRPAAPVEYQWAEMSTHPGGLMGELGIPVTAPAPSRLGPYDSVTLTVEIADLDVLRHAASKFMTSAASPTLQTLLRAAGPGEIHFDYADRADAIRVLNALLLDDTLAPADTRARVAALIDRFNGQ